jgi:hypothetical protein
MAGWHPHPTPPSLPFLWFCRFSLFSTHLYALYSFLFVFFASSLLFTSSLQIGTNFYGAEFIMCPHCFEVREQRQGLLSTNRAQQFVIRPSTLPLNQTAPFLSPSNILLTVCTVLPAVAWANSAFYPKAVCMVRGQYGRRPGHCQLLLFPSGTVNIGGVIADKGPPPVLGNIYFMMFCSIIWDIARPMLTILDYSWPVTTVPTQLSILRMRGEVIARKVDGGGVWVWRRI